MTASRKEREKRKAERARKLDKLVDHLRHESDRGLAVLSGELLSELLRQHISRRIVDFKRDPHLNSEQRENLENATFRSPYAMFGGFSNQINGAYLLGLISPIEFTDLHIIRDIRNDFAHSLHDVSFKSSEIVEKCHKLRIAEFYLTRALEEEQSEKIDNISVLVREEFSPKVWFFLDVLSLEMFLWFRELHDESARLQAFDLETVLTGFVAPKDREMTSDLWFWTRKGKFKDFASLKHHRR